MIHEALYGTTVNDDVTVDDSGDTVVVPAVPGRRYLFIAASEENDDVVFLCPTPEDVSAEWSKGIPMAPGAWHEWSYWNQYTGPVKAIAAPGKTGVLHFHYGR